MSIAYEASRPRLGSHGMLKMCWICKSTRADKYRTVEHARAEVLNFCFLDLEKYSEEYGLFLRCFFLTRRRTRPLRQTAMIQGHYGKLP
jgi:hypothetical protein